MICKKCGECCNITANIKKKEVYGLRKMLKKDIKLLKYINNETDRRMEEMKKENKFDLSCFFKDRLTKKCLIYNKPEKPEICNSYKCWISENGNDKRTLKLKKENSHMIADVLKYPREIIMSHYLKMIKDGKV